MELLNILMDEITLLFLHRTAYKVMMDFAQRNLKREVIGVFFGKIKEKTLEIYEAYPFRVGKHTSVEFIDSDYEQVYPLIKDCEQRELQWVGWFHSHPFKGDHLYMSDIDIKYQLIQQNQNSSWTALVLNPYQIKDPNTFEGIQAFQLVCDPDSKKLIKKTRIIPLKFMD